jgi:hypothetical protein
MKKNKIKLGLKRTIFLKEFSFVAAILTSYPFSKTELGAMISAALYQALST